MARVLYQRRVNLMAEKGINLERLLREYGAFIANLLFQRFHGMILVKEVARM